MEQIVCAAAAGAVLDVIEEENIQGRALELGKLVDKYLNNIFDTFNDCIEVRGKGLMWGIELEPKIASKVFESLKDNNYLVGLGVKKECFKSYAANVFNRGGFKGFHNILYETMDKYSTKK